MVLFEGNPGRGTCVLLLTVVILALSCGRRNAQGVEMFSCPAPNGSKVAVFRSIIDGGAAGTAIRYVGVHSPPESSETIVFSMSGGDDVVLDWRASDLLQITFPRDAVTFRTLPTYRERLDDGGELRIQLVKRDAEVGRFTDVERRCLNTVANQ